MSNGKEIYAHDKQIAFIEDTTSKVSCVLGQRAAGKTGALAYRFYQRAVEMPGGRFFLGAGTLEQLINSILPNIFLILSADFSINLEEGEDYVIGTKPPTWFKKPIQKPKRYNNIVSWSNGSWTELITPRKLQPVRGSSTDGGDIDEGLLWQWKLISQVLLPTFRGNKNKFSKCELHQTLGIYSSLPRTAEAMWLMSMEKKAKADPKTFGFYFFRWKDNVSVIGEDYGERMAATMDPIEKAIEIDGIINIKTGMEYYHKFSYQKHTYVTSKGYINNTYEKEYNPFAPIDLSLDFSSHINVMWVIQPNGLEVRCIEGLHVKFKEKLRELVIAFDNRYKNHQNRRLNLYGEPHGSKAQPNDKPLFEQLQELFIKFGWEVVIWVQPYEKADLHKKRYVYMNDMLEENEEKPYLPYIRINADKCEDAIIAIQKTKVTTDYKKDKSDEKKIHEFPQEHAPHYTDALDYYVKQKFGWGGLQKFHGSGSAGTT